MAHAITLFLLLVFSTLTNIQASELVISKLGDSFKEFTVDLYEDRTNQLSFDLVRQKKNFTPSSNHLSKGYSESEVS